MLAKIIMGVFLASIVIPPMRRLFYNYIPKVPKFVVLKTIDLYRYIRYKEWKIFQGFGIHVYIGLFGKGKTISMVQRAYKIAKQYPQVTVYTNLQLFNFPAHTTIIKLENYKQIMTAPPNSLFVIDEISTLFQSRSWSKFPMPLLSSLFQVRKNRKMIIATAQRFEHVDKLIRDVTYSVIDCNLHFRRWAFLRSYMAEDWEKRSPTVPAERTGIDNYLQTDKIRKMFDTYEIIDEKQASDFLSAEEIINRQGTSTVIMMNDGLEKKKSFLSKLAK